MYANDLSINFPKMMKISDASAQSGLSPYALRKLCRTGKVRFVCTGSRWLINADSLAAFLEGDIPAERENKHS